MPIYDVLFPDYPKSKQSDLDLIMRDYFLHTFQDLCIFFSEEDFSNPIYCDLKRVNKQLKKEEKEKLDNLFEINKCIYFEIN